MTSLTPKQHQQIIDLYQVGQSIHQIASVVNCRFQTVSKHLKKAGVPTRERSAATRAGRAANPDSGRRYVCNHDYFALINTPEKAYWLGFLAADGCVLDTGVVQLSLCIDDCAHLLRFREALQSNYPIYERPNCSTKRSKNSAVLAFLSRKMSL